MRRIIGDSRSEIDKIKKKLFELGEMLPGSISEQWNVCGAAVCRCKDAKDPQKHGPYFQLSYSVNRKSSSMFIKAEDLAEARKRIGRYQEFKELNMQLAEAYVNLVRSTGFNNKKTKGGKHE